MLPQIPIIRVTDSQKVPMPTYLDGVGTSMILRSNEMKSIKIAPKQFEVFSTGFAIALPIGMEAQVRSLKESTKNGVIVLNAPATIDASDRKEIKVCLFNASQESIIIKQGDPIALLIFSMALRVQWKDLTQRSGEEVSDVSNKASHKPAVVQPSILVDQSDQPNGIIQPVIRQGAEQSEESSVSEENPLVDEAVAPPAILEEFEKIESDFENAKPEGAN